MPTERERREFLAKASEAEACADRTQDPQLKKSWLEIAQRYRALAGAPAGNR